MHWVGFLYGWRKCKRAYAPVIKGLMPQLLKGLCPSYDKGLMPQL
ncbi:hypothetical protein F383_14592 [Gossypium arboreum]|uniref:Uncharacterized protein n=1 Tax=Gossypium arboreum TaxID=29729 RepID=A0A0B0NEI8_GOSAR|nr:hypothetical protein F383_14592 [Gossypium arboreum]